LIDGGDAGAESKSQSPKGGDSRVSVMNEMVVAADACEPAAGREKKLTCRIIAVEKHSPKMGGSKLNWSPMGYLAFETMAPANYRGRTTTLPRFGCLSSGRCIGVTMVEVSLVAVVG
jgi:hypothetical protein